MSTEVESFNITLREMSELIFSFTFSSLSSFGSPNAKKKMR